MQNVISRKQYKNIKNMNRAALDKFLTEVYMRGYEEGAKGQKKLDTISFMEEVLEDTKGVGDVLKNRILLQGQEKLRRERQ